MNEMPEGAEGVEIPEEGLPSGIGVNNSLRAVLIAMIAVLVLAFQIVSSHFIVKAMFFSKSKGKASAEEVQQKPETPKNIGQIYRMENILVNPKATRGAKHLMVDLGLEVSSQKVLTELDKLDPLLRDNIITLLSSQPMDVLTNIEMRDVIRRKIQEVANYYLSDGEVKKVYFIRYVFP